MLLKIIMCEIKIKVMTTTYLQSEICNKERIKMFKEESKSKSPIAVIDL